jgi:predicted nuclease of predicted toxin-antitoxin system
MRFNLDENLGRRTVELFASRGHDVCTVRQEGLSAADARLFEVCALESRCLVTLDLDFSDLIRFPPQDSAGIVVIRAPLNPNLEFLRRMISDFLNAPNLEDVKHSLWIVEPGRVRIRQSTG